MGLRNLRTHQLAKLSTRTNCDRRVGTKDHCMELTNCSHKYFIQGRRGEKRLVSKARQNCDDFAFEQSCSPLLLLV